MGIGWGVFRTLFWSILKVGEHHVASYKSGPRYILYVHTIWLRIFRGSCDATSAVE
jgi:hypothetical protein